MSKSLCCSGFSSLTMNDAGNESLPATSLNWGNLRMASS
ncbi:Uncharacterised protein [Mycobacterium tuberculosis]|nr:Uncharacterised protein [Mycobacterium tuberculosis]COY42511.1 Uncharacterised protein [Mycobacterium tuberculosis]